jgi:hypothetical protein
MHINNKRKKGKKETGYVKGRLILRGERVNEGG